MKNKILITGGRGFIGYNFIRKLSNNSRFEIVNIDKRSYSSQNFKNLFKLFKNVKDYKIDIYDFDKIFNLISDFQPNIIINFAAETHVDRSIESPKIFLDTNIIGTYNLLLSSLKKIKNKKKFKFIHISTDEVFGDLKKGRATEASPYNPSSPYSSSKAASDHLVSAWSKTYDLPTIITNCSNNYGPYQFPEKLIPITIYNAISSNKILVYGNGLQKRDWIHVDDHVSAIYKLMLKGKLGENYNIGTGREFTNIVVVKKICKYINRKKIIKKNCFDLINFVRDRPGHDQRYAINSDKMNKYLKWKPIISFDEGIKKTIDWYLDNQKWSFDTLKGRYNSSRLGLKLK